MKSAARYTRGALSSGVDVVLALGTNLGDRAAHLLGARALLEAEPALSVVDASSVYETPPVGPPQPDYLNAALLVRTGLDAEAVLERCLAIERQLGRVRGERWGPRTIDLDLLWAEHDGRVLSIASPTLTLPHPHLAERSFALAPLLDVRPDLAPRFAPILAGLGGAPPRTPVKGWTSALRQK
jgi:2-amino-4-hydroxy-6-hydroxymethyldihydropteridine diphosphokinase